MIRTTSKKAYKDIRENGTSNTQKEKILSVLWNSPYSLSLREICQRTGFDINAVSGRVNDLKKEERVVECARRRCSITGRLIVPVTVAEGRLFQ